MKLYRSGKIVNKIVQECAGLGRVLAVFESYQKDSGKS